MGATDLLVSLKSMGLDLRVHDGELLAQPRSSLTDETRALIRAHKSELIDLLARTPAETPTSPLSMRAKAMLDLNPTLLAEALTLTKSQARALMDAHKIAMCLAQGDGYPLLEGEDDLALLGAYGTILRIAKYA